MRFPAPRSYLLRQCITPSSPVAQLVNCAIVTRAEVLLKQNAQVLRSGSTQPHILPPHHRRLKAGSSRSPHPHPHPHPHHRPQCASSAR